MQKILMAFCYWYRRMNDDKSDSVTPEVPGEIAEGQAPKVAGHLLD